jgi:hypothetical protein
MASRIASVLTSSNAASSPLNRPHTHRSDLDEARAPAHAHAREQMW